MQTNFLPKLQRTYVAAGTAVAEIGYGIYKSSKDKKAQKELIANRPKYTIPSSTNSELQLAESGFSNPISAGAEQAYTEGLDSSLAGSLGAILKGGGDANNISDALSGDARGRQQFALLKDQARLQQQQNLVSAYRNQTDQQDKQFLYNVDAPFKDQMQATGQNLQSDSNLINSGINTAGSALTGYASNKAADARYAKYFGDNSTTSSTPNPISGGNNIVLGSNTNFTNRTIPTSAVNRTPTTGQTAPTNFVDFSDYNIPYLE